MKLILKKKLFLILTVAIAFLGFSSQVSAGGVVVVHPNNSSDISKADVKYLFLGKKKKFKDGSAAIAVNHTFGTSFREAFDKAMLGKTPPQMKSYWAKLVFTGKGSPLREAENDKEMIELVVKNESVIGYIDESNVTDAVKVVFKF